MGPNLGGGLSALNIQGNTVSAQLQPLGVKQLIIVKVMIIMMIIITGIFHSYYNFTI